ncbi:hypothetical protein ACUNWD_12390 [Sunxiuqinia sp. A32]|uniref:hypothetical protein n=1 Tax=Sunxiuqinia sp. A32 TaxID=3461496 RepID=UPI004045937C
MRKFVFPAILILVILVGAFFIYLTNQSKNYSENSAFKAVPLHTPLIVEVPQIKDFLNELNEKTPLIEELQSINELSKFFQEINVLRNLFKDNNTARKLFQSKAAVISFNFAGKDEIGSLIAISLNDRSERNQILSLINNYPTGKFTKRMYDDVEIYRWTNDQQEYHFAVKDGVFLFSHYALFVEEATRQLSAENILNQKQFKDLYGTVGTSSDFNLYFNHDKFPQLIGRAIPRDFRKSVNAFGQFADWSELDVTIDETSLLMGGFSFSNDSNNNYLNVFRKQEAGRSGMEDVISANASFFINLNLDDLSVFFQDYEEFLKKQGDFYTRETELQKIEKAGKSNFIKLFTEIADDNFAMVFGNVTQNQPTSNRFFIASVKSQSQARERLLKVLENNAKSEKRTLKDLKTSYQIQNEQSFDIYEFPFANLPQLLFGKAFTGSQSNYLCFYENYLIFSDNVSSIKNYIHDLVLSETLDRDIHYKKFEQQLASKSTFYLYLNFSKAFFLKDYYLNEKFSEVLKENEESIRKFHALGWQFSGNSGQFLNNLYLKFDPVLKEEPQTVWQSKLDSTVAIKPQLVDNHNDPKNKEVIIQDNKNNLYLINKEGVRLWKVKLPGKIMSEIYQVDFYRNGKLQYLFNTKDKLYLIDRNGNNVARFPINFRSPASNGVALIDYDNNRNYRFFIACENKKVYAYDREGKIVNGWKFGGTDNLVSQPIKHFRVNMKDYIVCADQYKTYILDRQGNIRVKTAGNFEHSGNDLFLTKGTTPAIATTDINGEIHLQYFDGASKTLKTESFGKDHFFLARDVNADGKSDYIFADDNKLYAFSDQGKKLLERRFNSAISERPNLYIFSNTDRKIGVVCRKENRVYLVNSNGNIYEGFPLHGNTDFSIGYFNRSNSYFNLVVGNEDNSFFNYKVQ